VVETIVVGVDGSAGGTAALEFAAEEAVLRKVPLRVLCAWEVPAAVYTPGTAPSFDPEMLDAFRVRAEHVADEALATVKRLQPSVTVEALAAHGQPSEVLLEQGTDAELIVVGRRGLGGLKSLLLGSVSQQVVHRATSPVVVVADRSDAEL
jgi:nucleotide-binding universal stress UspA family protein